MKPIMTPSAKAEASDVIGRSDMMLSRWSSCSSQGLAEIIQSGLNLIGELDSAILRVSKMPSLAVFSGRPRSLLTYAVHLSIHLSLEHRSCPGYIIRLTLSRVSAAQLICVNQQGPSLPVLRQVNLWRTLRFRRWHSVDEEYQF